MTIIQYTTTAINIEEMWTVAWSLKNEHSHQFTSVSVSCVVSKLRFFTNSVLPGSDGSSSSLSDDDDDSFVSSFKQQQVFYDTKDISRKKIKSHGIQNSYTIHFIWNLSVSLGYIKMANFVKFRQIRCCI